MLIYKRGRQRSFFCFDPDVDLEESLEEGAARLQGLSHSGRPEMKIGARRQRHISVPIKYDEAQEQSLNHYTHSKLETKACIHPRLKYVEKEVDYFSGSKHFRTAT